MTTHGLHGVTHIDITDRIGETEHGKYRSTVLTIDGRDGRTEVTLFSDEPSRPLPIEDLRHFDKRVEIVADSLPKVDYAVFARLFANLVAAADCAEYCLRSAKYEAVPDYLANAINKAKAALGQ